MTNYEKYRQERFEHIKSIEKKDEIIKKAKEIANKMNNYINKKITIYYQCSGGGFWKLREFKKIEFKEHKFNDGISILDCYIYGIPKGCKKVHKNNCSFWSFAIFDGWHNDFELPYIQDGWQTLKTRDMQEFIKNNQKSLIIDNIAEVVKSNIYNEDMDIQILQWQDKNQIGKILKK